MKKQDNVEDTNRSTIYTERDEEFWKHAARIKENKDKEAFKKLTFTEKLKAKKQDIGLVLMIILFVFLVVTDGHSSEVQTNMFEKEVVDINKIKVLPIPRMCSGKIILDYKIASKLNDSIKQLNYTQKIWNGLNDLEKKEAYQVLKNHSFQSEDYPNIRYLCVSLDRRLKT